MEIFVNLLINALGFYLLIGFLFSLLLLWKGLAKIDPNTIGSGIGFKLLVLPGLCAFWPLFVRKWLKSSKT